MSIAEIAGIARATDVELEVFVHGAMCVSYSGQCLASESFWGRSGNRGTCGQACRLPYALLVDGREQPAASGEHLLSPHDLAAYDHVGQLLSAGVSAFKIGTTQERPIRGMHHRDLPGCPGGGNAR